MFTERQKGSMQEEQRHNNKMPLDLAFTFHDLVILNPTNTD
jgi:hypothetical protein